MNMRFKCVCGNSIIVDRSKIGEKVTCPNCGSILRVPPVPNKSDVEEPSNPLSEKIKAAEHAQEGYDKETEKLILKTRRSILARQGSIIYLLTLILLQPLLLFACRFKLFNTVSDILSRPLFALYDFINSIQHAFIMPYITPICFVVLILSGLAMIRFVRLMIWSFRRRYRVTNQRLLILNGIIARDKLQILLIRIKDLNLHQSVVERVFNVGSVEVISTDETTDKLMIENVGHPNAFYEKLHIVWQEAIKNRGLVMW